MSEQGDRMNPFTVPVRPLLDPPPDGADTEPLAAECLMTDGAARQILVSCYGGRRWQTATAEEVREAWRTHDRPFYWTLEFLKAR